ncbi:MAG: ATP-binding protein [Flavobacteriales bacterium]|jgi:predicted kinase
MRELILLRGLPGSGKTTLAHVLSEDGKYPLFSVDDYFTDESGHYDFRFQENHLAYKQCEEGVKLAMQSHAQKIILHNTFTMEWEMEPYFKLAAEHDYRLHVLTAENRHGNKNVHDIPEEHIERMRAKYAVKL